ncbi:MAG: hydroxyacid dehydrogenase [Alphaproteobacteria bacterium HGW-Alphaproteobacteria-8]|nr:MAG: hydroxyacid dehydrogenase [Alphaproteobacteria bacterium HGW-Alphaproteobacteria-8]
MTDDRPLVIAAPAPRALPEIFTSPALARLKADYRVIETDAAAVAGHPALAEARYVIGQPPLDTAALTRAAAMRAIFNVEGNLLDNMDYATCFARGVHVLTTAPVFAEPVAEIGLCFALALARDVVAADAAFREGRERWGFAGNAGARLIGGSEIGFVGFGDLGRALRRLLSGFRVTVRAFDPWLPDAALRDADVIPASLDSVLRDSDTVFVVAPVTTENQGFLGVEAFAMMRPGASLILLSRAGVVDFPALLDAVRSGHIRAASDVFPHEPPAPDDPLRTLPGLLRSAHRAGALDAVMLRMGDLVLDDMALMDRGLPPARCKRAERETAARMRSRPVAKT